MHHTEKMEKAHTNTYAHTIVRLILAKTLHLHWFNLTLVLNPYPTRGLILGPMKSNGSTDVSVYWMCVPKAPLVGNKASAPTHSVTTLEYKGAASIGKHTQPDIMAVFLQQKTHNSVQICWTLSSLRPHFLIMGAEMEAVFFIPDGAILHPFNLETTDNVSRGHYNFNLGHVELL